MFRFFLLLSISLVSSIGLTAENPIVVIIASYNNQAYARKNILSVLNQNYNNYRVIYIDDHSQDKTLYELTYAIKDHPKKDLVQIFRNNKNLGAMENHYNAVKRCKSHEICVILDGDDWLSSEESLAILNRYYQNYNCWMTWGSYLEFPEMKKGIYSKPVEAIDLIQAKLRKKHWQTSHLRSFFAGLFQKIKKEDLQMDGKFFSVCCDVAEMLPMLEMAREKALYIPDILYIYNKMNPISDSIVHHERREKVLKKIAESHIYEKINHF